MTLSERLDAAIEASLVDRIVGCVVLVNRDGKQIYRRGAGLTDREENRPMLADSIFRLASVTKPIVATAVLRLCERGEIALDDPVTHFLPWFTPTLADGRVPVIRIRDLLTHTSGLTYDLPDTISQGPIGPVISLEENLRRLAALPLAFEPCTKWAYGMSLDVLGGVLAVINGSDLQAALERHVFAPLGIRDTRFVVADTARLTTQYGDGPQGSPPVRMGDPHTVHRADGFSMTVSPGRILDPDAPQSGGAGLSGTADDVMAVLDSYQTGALLTPETIRMALSNQIGEVPRVPGEAFSFIGSLSTDPSAAKAAWPAGTVAWGGGWGHNWFLDPVNRLTVLTCTNTMFEGLGGRIRFDVIAAVYGAGQA